MKTSGCACSICQIPNFYSLPTEVRVTLVELAFNVMPKASASELIAALKTQFPTKH
ncbi:MAG: hypothetical protein AAB575_00410 [Patescibacteria group bacterium]